MNEDRPRIVERVERDGTPEGARRNRSNGMIGLGAVLALWGIVAAGSGSLVAFLLALLGIGLLVGGLAIRR